MNALQDIELRRRKRERILVLVLLTLVTIFTVVEIQLLRTSAQLPFVNSIFFFGLMNLNIILIMLLLFLVFRNAVKLILDERGRKPGSRLRTRLVLSFSLFAIIPTVLLFCVSAFYIKSSFDKWFTIKIGGTLQKSIEVVHQYYDNTKREGSHFVRKIASNLLEDVSPQKIQKILERSRIEYELDGVEYYANLFSDRLVSVHPDREDQIPPASLETLQRHFSGTHECNVQNVGVGELVRCGAYLGVGRGIVLVDYFIPTGLASQLSEISMTYDDFISNNPLQYPIKSTYFALLSMMTLLILFSATWTGFYVARRLSVPLEELSKGTLEIQRGNLSYQIPSSGSDELAGLIDSFNHMTRDLKESKEHVESANAHLKQVNSELSHRRRYIEVLLESVQSGVMSIDESGEISMLNQAAIQLLKVEDRVLGKPYWVVLPREIREEFRQTLVTLYETRKPIKREFKVSEVGGSTQAVTLLVTLSLLHDESGKSLGILAVFDDVTDLQKMQRMTAWREVANRIAHEIKNPLTPIQLSVQRLRRRYLDKISDDGTFDEATHIVLTEVESLRKMVSEFSVFARLPEIQQVPDNLNEIILESANFFRAAHDRIIFDLSLEETLPLMALDRSQLKRVLLNLFDNAVAAMEQKGRISVETKRCSPMGIELTVADEGSGIGEEVKGQLFEPYFSTKAQGTGLGLAIVQRIIHDHGGWVRLVENTTRGTKFSIFFPESLVVVRNKKKGSELSEVSI